MHTHVYCWTALSFSEHDASCHRVLVLAEVLSFVKHFFFVWEKEESFLKNETEGRHSGVAEVYCKENLL